MAKVESLSLQRALHVLEALREHPDGLTLADLLARVDISRSALFVLLGALKRLGYVEQADKRGRYFPGPRLLAWRAGASPLTHLQTAFYQEAGAWDAGETLALVLPAHGEAVLAAQIEAEAQVRSVFPAGFCFSPQSAAARVLSAVPPSPAARRNGYVWVKAADTVELAVPICADGQTPCAALVLSAPAFRWRRANLPRYAARLREMAIRLSYRLGATRYTPWRSAAASFETSRRPLSALAMRDFLNAPWIARLACLRPDGAPHVVPVWQEWDGQSFYVVAWPGSLWAEYVLANPHVSLTIDEPWPPLRRVLARGRAVLLQHTEAPGGVDALLSRLRRRYLGPGSVLPATTWRAFRIVPDTLNAWQGLS
ncbi:MAG: helix-turn-helix domain-containing protein [Anaerolineae bacterium]|nr:helix-turn-helix domain-containing protein [Thermoflexales bacterium]MDW8407218.1 helix-turn-helix domain-containing protein [Anaerolineae bacterium]